MAPTDSQKDIDYGPAKPSAGFFDRIICVIHQEQEFKQTKKILYLFIFLLLISLASIPFSLLFFVNQWERSGVDYFIAIAISSPGTCLHFWQDFSLSILESLPVLSIALFALNLALVVFTLRLFLHKKGLLLKYIKHNLT